MSDEHVDVIIVGAGIIGIACAYYLRAAGQRVVVVEQNTIGSGCSHANCGYVCPSHVLPLTEPGAVANGVRSLLNPKAAFRVKPQLRLSLYQWLFQFARRCNERQMLAAGHHLQSILDYSADEYQKLMATKSLDCEWKNNGLLYVFETTRGLSGFAATDALLAEAYDLKAQRIEGVDLPEFDAALKPGLAGAYFYDDDASLRPDKLVRSWSALTRQQGVTYLEGNKLEGVEKSNGRLTGIVTSRGLLRADNYVFATGAWSRAIGEMLNCRLPVEAGKGYSVTMSRPELAPRHPMLLPEHRVGVTPFDEGYRLGSMMELSGHDTSIPDFRIRQLQDSAAPYLHQPVGRVVEETWYGWRPMTWDSLPILGIAPSLSNVVLATGHNMLGLSLAPGTGRLVADLIVNDTTEVPIDAFSAKRFL